MAKVQGIIKIVNTPTGDAPNFVKKACVGLTLPFYDRVNPDKNHEFEIGSGTMETTRKGAFCVTRDDLFLELSKKDPEASSWLRKNCPIGDFSFGPDIVQEVQ